MFSTVMAARAQSMLAIITTLLPFCYSLKTTTSFCPHCSAVANDLLTVKSSRHAGSPLYLTSQQYLTPLICFPLGNVLIP